MLFYILAAIAVVGLVAYYLIQNKEGGDEPKASAGPEEPPTASPSE